jgi:hypothetical protein
MAPTTAATVTLRLLDGAERDELVGPCSLCGTRRKDEPRSWRLVVSLPGWDEPAEYSACSRCRRALREVAEIAFGENIAGLIDFQGDAPY